MIINSLCSININKGIFIVAKCCILVDKKLKMTAIRYLGISLVILQSCSYQYKKIAKNEYGLQVISKIGHYNHLAKTDTNKQMVALKKYIPHVIFEWKYATTNNFTNRILYTKPDAFMRIEAAEALHKIATELETQGLGLKIFDAYRPYSVTKTMWEVVPDDRYAANPAKGSGHNRGAAVDLTLYNLKTGEELEMPTPFDDFTEKAHISYMQLANNVLQNRAILINIMRKYGFIALETEWWHFYLPDAAQRFELMDLNFNKMRRITK